MPAPKDVTLTASALDSAPDRGAFLDRRFSLSARGSTHRVEFLAALTTFATMSYVLAVHPYILAQAGMDQAALVTVTALVAGVFSILMGVMANLPIAQAPGMGVNGFFAFNIVLTMGVPVPAALGLVFWTGVAFLMLSVTGVRHALLAAFPEAISHAMTVGLGLFILFIGLKGAGIVVPAPEPIFVALGDVTSPPVLLALAGVPLMLALKARALPGAIVVSIAILTAIGTLVTDPETGARLTRAPAAFVAPPADLSGLALSLDLGYLFAHFGRMFPVVLTLLFIDLFTSLVAMNAMCRRAGLADADGNLPNPRRALSADALATIGGALAGTSTTNCFIESAAGIETGGRTGLVALWVGAFFLIAMFAWPLIVVVPVEATAPALVLIGLMMFAEVARIDFADPAIAAPAALTIVLMPLTTISDGLALGLIAYVLVMPLAGRAREVHRLSYGLAAVFAGFYALTT